MLRERERDKDYCDIGRDIVIKAKRQKSGSR